MPTAFGQAMLATINGQPQRFRMTMQKGPSTEMNCSDFLSTREEENRLLIALSCRKAVMCWTGVAVWGGTFLMCVRTTRQFTAGALTFAT